MEGLTLKVAVEGRRRVSGREVAWEARPTSASGLPPASRGGKRGTAVQK